MNVALKILLLGVPQCWAVLEAFLLVLSKLGSLDSTVPRPELRTCLPMAQRTPTSLD